MRLICHASDFGFVWHGVIEQTGHLLGVDQKIVLNWQLFLHNRRLREAYFSYAVLFETALT